MKPILNQLLNQLIKIGSPLLSIFQKGISKSYIDSKLIMYKINFPKEVYDLYAWKNGISDSVSEAMKIGEISLFRLGIFDLFETSLEIYKEYCVEHSYWQEGLFPLFSSGGGDNYLIDLRKGSPSLFKIVFFSPGNPDFDGTITICDSIQSLLKSVLECYKLGAFYYEIKDNLYLLYKNYKIEHKVFKNNNPKSEYWKLLDTESNSFNS